MPRERWLEILNWPTFPVFGKIHNLKQEEFINNYYLPNDLEEIFVDIEFCLNKPNTSIDKLLIGKPGCGKTTFLYYFRDIILKNSKSLKEKYFMEIVHFNRFISASIESSIVSIETWAIDLYTHFLTSLGMTSEVLGVLRNDEKYPDRNSKINAMLNIIKSDSVKSRKKLVICIDDIDEAPFEKVEDILRHLFSYMETASIEKWLSVRGITLDHYKISLASFIERKFPEWIDLPRVDFYGILEKRITASGGQVKNPYSKLLCSNIIKVQNADIRNSLGFALLFLNIHPAKGYSSKTRQRLIEGYFENKYFFLLISIRIFPNIYLYSRSSRFPLEREILLLIDTKHTVDEEFVKILNEYFQATITTIDKKGEVYDKEWHNITKTEIDGSIKYLVDNKLIESRDGDAFFLTGRGRIFKSVLFENIYKTHCLDEVARAGEVKAYPFWALVDINPSFDGFLPFGEAKHIDARK